MERPDEPEGWEDAEYAAQYVEQFLAREPGKPVLSPAQHAVLIAAMGKLRYQEPEEDDGGRAAHFHSIGYFQGPLRCRCGSARFFFVRDPATLSVKGYALWHDAWVKSRAGRLRQIASAVDAVRDAQALLQLTQDKLMD